MSGKQRVTRHSRSGTAKSSQPSLRQSSPASSKKPVENATGASSSATAPPKQARDTTFLEQLTNIPRATGEPEPRRSVRATKGQHTKAFDDGPEPPKRKGGKKGKKQAQSSQQEEDDEIIRCICGAISQDDDDANEPWIACDECGAWQHNVCMGMSRFSEDLPNKYYCEKCKPGDHEETLAAISRGESPWETRRLVHESEKKKGKKGKRGKGKRTSDPKDRSSPAASSTKARPSPTPEVKREETAPESASKGKRKTRDHSQSPQVTKIRKVSETKAVPATPEYSAPADLAEGIDKLPDPRKAPAQGIKKSLDAAFDLAVKNNLFTPPKDSVKKALTERHALEIERAVHDLSPNAVTQVRTLMYNLKANVELAARVFNRTLLPNTLALMASEDMATQELKRETAEMKARAEKQAILITDDGPRVRRTHKGEEVIETDNGPVTAEENPSMLRRQSVRDTTFETRKATDADTSSGDRGEPSTVSGPLRVDTQMSPQLAQQQHRQAVDIDKAFSSVRSPSGPQQRRPSGPVRSAGPGEDPEVDRMLQDDGTDSPPYSPAENVDPDVVWSGHLVMTNHAEFLPLVAKHVGGADLSKVKDIAWKSLIPPMLTVAGRIPEEKAVPYLCSLRYNNQIDLVITCLTPAEPANAKARDEFRAVINYFQSKKRYGVVGERKLGNVRDTYLVPVAEGDGPIPEPMQNIEHLIPSKRPEPLLLMVFVVRDESRPAIPMEQQAAEMQQATPNSAQFPTPGPDRKLSIAQPSWSPSTPQQATFPSPGSALPHHQQSHTPIPPPVIPSPGPQAPLVPQQRPPTAMGAPAAPVAPPQDQIEALRRDQAEGETQARQVLGQLFASPTITFLLPHASRMKEGEWKAVKRCLERDPRAREDLPLLSKLLTEDGNASKQNANGHGQQAPGQPTAASPGVAQTTLAAATAAGATSAAAPPASAPEPPPAAQPKA